MDADQLRKLPSTFYRVAVKCLIFDDGGKLLVAKNKDGVFELPGGGWEHEESLTACIQRELEEELGVQAASIGDIKMVLQGRSERGFAVLRVAVAVELGGGVLTPGDDIVAAKYVNKEEFAGLVFAPVDEPFGAVADQIWSNH